MAEAKAIHLLVGDPAVQFTAIPDTELLELRKAAEKLEALKNISASAWAAISQVMDT